MTQRPAFDAPVANGHDAATAVLDRPEPSAQRAPGGYYDPDSCSFEPSDYDSAGWQTLAVNQEPEGTVPASRR
jgi:hypothetical protein